MRQEKIDVKKALKSDFNIFILVNLRIILEYW